MTRSACARIATSSAVVLAFATLAHAGPAIKQGSASAGFPFECAIGANFELGRLLGVCFATGGPRLGSLSVFARNPDQGAPSPVAVISNLPANGPWNFSVPTSGPIAAAFGAGQVHVGANDMSGTRVATAPIRPVQTVRRNFTSGNDSIRTVFNADSSGILNGRFFAVDLNTSGGTNSLRLGLGSGQTLDLDPGPGQPNVTDGLVNQFAIGVLPSAVNILDPSLAVTVETSGAGGTRTFTPNACQPRDVRTDDPNTGTTLCLNDERFKVTVDWETTNGSGTGNGLQISNDRGLFTFFSATTDLLVHVFDACGINNNFWVFAAAATNVGYELTVTDTQSNQSRRYTNPLGQPADAVTDTAAFATCP